MFRVTRRYCFSASHRLHCRSLSEAANRELYGKCNNPYGHGHNYTVEITARGPADTVTARAVDTGVLDELVNREVIAALDQRNLNEDIAAFAVTVPTSENVAVEICRRLKANWSRVFPGEWPKLDRIRIAETDRNIFEIESDEIE